MGERECKGGIGVDGKSWLVGGGDEQARERERLARTHTRETGERESEGAVRGGIGGEGEECMWQRSGTRVDLEGRSSDPCPSNLISLISLKRLSAGLANHLWC